MNNLARLLAAVLAGLPCLGAARGTPGQFDYYLLSLSWSPQFCANQGAQAPPEQCGANRHFGFILHGLWPEYVKGWPEYCETEPADVPPDIVEAMLPLTPGRSLIEHEWDRHGKCSGLSVQDYFDTQARWFRRFVAPHRLEQATVPFKLTPQRIKHLLRSSNPQLPLGSITVLCQGKNLSEIRLCYGKDGHAVRCSTDVAQQQCTRSKVNIVPRP